MTTCHGSAKLTMANETMKNLVSLTTTLPYVNSDPHIGFALEIIQADVMARYYQQQGKEVFFNTGTDEHGLKIFRAAQAAGQDPQTYVDEYAAKFGNLKKALNLSYNSFIRTTNPDHIVAAQEFWKRCDAAGDIYKKNYQIQYCVGCELEKTSSELNEQGRCTIHPNLEIEVIDEENYFFKFSKYQDALLKLYDEHPQFVVPEHRLKEIRNFVKGGLEDFSISRLKEKMAWGVPVPGDETQVMYVWFDALINYISCLGWPDKKYSQWWPSIQFAGKDNLRQQAAMWQAMLLSAAIEPSKQIVIHGFITSDGKKISKSLGNVVDPFALVEKYGTDAVRYYLLRHVSPFEDSDFTMERFADAYTADLANGLGNLVSRVSNMLEKFADGTFSRKTVLSESQLVRWQRALESYRFDQALEIAGQHIEAANQLIDEKAPWKMAKEGTSEELIALLEDLANRVLNINILIKPFLPETADAIDGVMKTPVKKAEPLFPRIP